MDAVAFSRDGKLFAIACYSEVKVFDVAAREERATLKPGTGGSMNALAFNPDGELLAIGGKLWDISSLTAPAKRHQE